MTAIAAMRRHDATLLASTPSAHEQYSTATSLGDEILEREIGDFMTPGCVCISDDATVEEAAQALTTHRVHAVLVLGAKNGTPLGWVTARGLLGWVSRDRNLASARDAITEQVTAIDPGASRARRALRALDSRARPGCSSGGGRTSCPRA